MDGREVPARAGQKVAGN